MLLRTSLVALTFLGLVAAESGDSSSGEENISVKHYSPCIFLFDKTSQIVRKCHPTLN